MTWTLTKTQDGQILIPCIEILLLEARFFFHPLVANLLPLIETLKFENSNTWPWKPRFSGKGCFAVFAKLHLQAPLSCYAIFT